MSLSSLLLSSAGKKAIDTELDALFTAKPVPTTPFKKAATAISIPGSSKDAIKKKRKSAPDDDVLEESSKRSKPSPSKAGKQTGAEVSEKTATTINEKTQKKEKITTEKRDKKDKKGKAKEVEAIVEDEENSDLENAYLGDLADENNNSDDEEDGEAQPALVHESLQKDGNKKARSGPKAKFVPQDETSEKRDQRTIFIGNLSVGVASKRPLLKQLQRHILSHVPSAKIESTRFRSIPFQAPTAKLPGDDADPTKAPKTPIATPAKTAARPHDLDRASTWRSRQDADDTAGRSDEKQYLNPNQKKKIAFINQEFHSTADTVNAYVVFAHPQPVENRPANLPPPPSVLDPYEAARLAVKECDGSLFMDRMIRVDLVGKKKVPGGESNEGDLGLETDPKSSVFVGNLDFASKEEDLRVFFEGIVSGERGPPSPATDEEDETAKKPTSWVTRVRIVRDKDTQLGKGFAYVQFADRECVDEILAMESTKLKFAKRKLRVQRCKTLPGSSISTRQATAESKAGKSKSFAPIPAIIVPKGDPRLGEKLAGLPKDARKQYKSADADRVARRLAKKKARMAMGGKAGGKVLGKERVRERKTAGAGGAGTSVAKKKKASSGRVRSEKSVAKRNGKKSG